jgi:hypothetical protein
MNNNSDNKNTSSKKTGNSRTSDNVVDYKYSPRVENPNPKSTTSKSPSSGNIKGV